MAEQRGAHLLITIGPPFWALHVWCNLWSNFLLTCAQNIHCTVSSNWTWEIAIWAIMLEKSKGVWLVSKLWTILLMEVHFSAANKIIFGQRMLEQVQHYKLMSDEVFSEEQCMADDSILAKVLFYDISEKLRPSSVLVLVDDANCYNRVAHAITSLIFQAFGAPHTPTASMLTAIQQMQFFLHTVSGTQPKQWAPVST